MQKKLTSLPFYLDILKTLIQPLVKKMERVWTFQIGLLKNLEIVMLSDSVSLTISLGVVGAFSGRIGLPPAVTGWAASCGDGP